MYSRGFWGGKFGIPFWKTHLAELVKPLHPATHYQIPIISDLRQWGSASSTTSPENYTFSTNYSTPTKTQLNWVESPKKESVKLLSSVASLIFRRHQSKKSSAAPELGGFCFSHLKVCEPGTSRCYPTDSQNDLLVGKVALQTNNHQAQTVATSESCQVQQALLLHSWNWRTVYIRLPQNGSWTKMVVQYCTFP